MFNRMKTVATFAAGAVAGLMLAACLTVQGSRPGVFGGEALILPLMALLLYVGYEAGRLSTLAQAAAPRRACTRRGRCGSPMMRGAATVRRKTSRWPACTCRADCGGSGCRI